MSPQLPRFFAPPLSEGELTLQGSEAHHLLHVRRLAIGAQVELFDGTGRVGTAIVTGVSKRDVTLHVEACKSDPDDASRLTLAIAFPKPDRARWMIEKLTELGVAQVVPLITERSVSSGKPINVTKLQQYIVDACKQCRRNTLLQLSEPIRLSTFLERRATEPVDRMFLADRCEGSEQQVPRNATVLIGPEGGFSEVEQQLILDHDAARVSFGKNILRVETAAVAAAVLSSLAAE